MNVLVFNPGSSSLKFELIEASVPAKHSVDGRKLLTGAVDPVGPHAKLSVSGADGRRNLTGFAAADHARAVSQIFHLWSGGKLLPGDSIRLDNVGLMAFRIVHGGGRYSEPAVIDEELLNSIESMGDLAPLHNANDLAVIRAARSAMSKPVPAIAIFDNGFHQTVPRRAHLYGLPLELSGKYGIRRYGFHGIAHKYLMLRYAQISGTPVRNTKLVTLHLGGGASAAAIHNGESVDTSMGFTPLEGLMMGTRCGDLDPAIVGFLARKEEIGLDGIDELLNRRSGLLGISGRSQDTRVLVKLADTNARADLALEIFSYRIRKYIGAYVAAMGGAQAVIFSGGIGENTPDIRRRVCEGLEWLGLELDPHMNATSINCEGRITRDGSRLHAYVIPAEEGLMMAHEAVRCHSLEVP